MKKVYILLACVLLLPKLSWAQHYIELTKKNTFHYGNTYLIDVPKVNDGNLLVQDPNNLIPTAIYAQMLRSRDTVFVVRKASIWKKNRFNVNALKKTTVLYFSPNQDSEYTNDTLKNVDSRFAQYRKIDLDTSILKKDSVLIYYVEGYGSSCCPRDPKWDKLPLSDFIKSFEKKYSVKIGKAYTFSAGEEGEFTDYFTLSGLTSEQKVKFIDERQFSLLLDTKELQKPEARLYTPFWIGLVYWKSKNNGLSQKILLDTPYPSVDIEPQFPGGIDAFLARFKSIKVDYETNAVISFVVRRDGSVSDVKVLRATYEKPIKEIEKLIKEGPKWIPGRLQDNIVSVQCTYKIHLNK